MQYLHPGIPYNARLNYFAKPKRLYYEAKNSGIMTLNSVSLGSVLFKQFGKLEKMLTFYTSMRNLSTITT
jgi:hypothetical protein